MKLKNLFLSLIAGAAAFVGCTVEGPTYLSEIKVSSSYVTLNKDGGSATITYVATESWSINECPNWVTISPMSGNAGEGKITFTASEATSTNEGTIYINCGKGKQTIKLLQQCEKQELPIMTVAEIMAAGDGTYRAKGVCTNIYNTTYGNWHLIDETGDMTIYGTLDASGAEKNFLSLGIEEGDIVTVEGPYQLYGTTPELVNVTVIAIEKSLIKVSADDEKAGQINVTNLEKEGGEFVLYLVNKGEGFGVNVPDEAKSWLSFSNLELVDAASNLYKLTMNASANNAGARSAAITLKTSKSGKEYTATATLTQEGSIVECSIAEFLAAPVDASAQYRLTGVIASVARADYGNVYITDYSGEAYIYGIGAKGDFEKEGLKVGDIITLVGVRGEYKGTPQMTGAQLESKKVVTPVTLDEFLAKADDPNTYYMVSGTVDEIVNDSYGNLYLKDGETRLYVYGTYPGWGATGDFRKGTIAAQGIEVGDKLTVIGVKSTYKEVPQVNGGIFFSLEKGTPEPEPEPEPGEGTLVYTLDTTGSLQGDNNSYAGNCDVVCNNITWNVNGNTQMNPWRIGGKSITDTDRTVFTKTAYPDALVKVALTVGTMNSITVNSAKLLVSTAEDFSGATEYPLTLEAGSTIEVIPEGGFPANAYYKYVFNVTVAENSNKFIQFSKVEFFK